MSRTATKAVALRDDEYDENGWPLGRITLEQRRYKLALDASPWVAEIEGLPGYFGLGATPHEALDRLRQSLGSRPHYRVQHKMRKVERLKADVRREHRAMAVAAQTRANSFGRNLGGGEGVDASAKAEGIGKTVVNQARARLAKEIDAPDGRRYAGVSKQALETAVRVSRETEEIDLLIAEQAPWLLEHRDARKKFPEEIG